MNIFKELYYNIRYFRVVPGIVTHNGIHNYAVTQKRYRKIAKFAFEAKQEIYIMVLGKNITRIGNDAFRNCYNLQGVEIRGKVKKIEEYTFINCFRLEKIKLPDSVKVISSWAFARCALKIVCLPKNLREIEERAFYKCENLETVVIHSGLCKISEEAFLDCPNLKTIVVDTDKGEDDVYKVELTEPFTQKKLDYIRQLLNLK